jgi:hypothetical protein
MRDISQAQVKTGGLDLLLRDGAIAGNFSAIDQSLNGLGGQYAGVTILARVSQEVGKEGGFIVGDFKV